ncbi:hypothetical protein MBGDF03_00049 [Thermoplasmatales archaeon SCGC AB-540-F20]|nr:hypothetical protein MBGDF03_00049 [Thermoplasmatales archaeon SCGC AB-540-F20]
MKKIKKIFIIGIVTLLLIGSSNLSIGMGEVVYSFDSPGDNPEGLVWIGNYLWHTNWGGLPAKLYKIDPSDGSVVKTWNFPLSLTGPSDLAWDGDYLWVAENCHSVDSRICKVHIGDVKLWILKSFDIPAISPQGLTWDGNYLWTADRNNGKIYKINPSNGNVVDSFDSPGDHPTGLAWDGDYLWNADDGTNDIYKIDPSGGSVVCSFDGPDYYQAGLAWDGDYLWNAGDWNNKIYKIEVEDEPPEACYSWEDADGDGPGTVINFDASESSDDCGILSYEWDWTSDGTYDATGEIISHDYGDTDNHDCTLKVTDCEGQTDTITKTVHAVSVEPPTVTTNEANGIGFDHATLNGNLDDMGGVSSCEVWFVWDTSYHDNYQDYEHETDHQTKTSIGSFSQFLDGLDPETLYHYRAVASNTAGTSQGDDVPFETYQGPEPPHIDSITSYYADGDQYISDGYGLLLAGLDIENNYTAVVSGEVNYVLFEFGAQFSNDSIPPYEATFNNQDITPGDTLNVIAHHDTLPDDEKECYPKIVQMPPWLSLFAQYTLTYDYTDYISFSISEKVVPGEGRYWTLKASVDFSEKWPGNEYQSPVYGYVPEVFQLPTSVVFTGTQEG